MGSALLAGSIRGLPAIPRWLWLTLIFSTGWSAATLLWAPNLWDSAHTLLKFAVLMTLALAVRPESLERGWDWAAAGMWIVLLTQVLLALGILPHDPGSVPPHGGFYNKNFMGEAAALILVAQLFRPQLSWTLLVLPASALLMSSSLAATGMALAGAVMALGFRRSWTRRTWLSASALLGPAAALGFLHAISNLRPYTWAHRLEIWSETMSQLSIFGHGPGAYSYWLAQWEHAHNDILELAFDYGLGVVGFIAVMAWVLTRSGSPRERAVLVCFLGIGLFAFPLHNPATALLAAVCAGGLLRTGAAVRDVQSGLGDLGGGRIPAGCHEHSLSHLQPAAERRTAVSARPQPPHRAGGVRHEPH